MGGFWPLNLPEQDYSPFWPRHWPMGQPSRAPLVSGVEAEPRRCLRDHLLVALQAELLECRTCEHPDGRDEVNLGEGQPGAAARTGKSIPQSPGRLLGNLIRTIRGTSSGVVDRIIGVYAYHFYQSIFLCFCKHKLDKYKNSGMI